MRPRVPLIFIQTLAVGDNTHAACPMDTRATHPCVLRMNKGVGTLDSWTHETWSFCGWPVPCNWLVKAISFQQGPHRSWLSGPRSHICQDLLLSPLFIIPHVIAPRRCTGAISPRCAKGFYLSEVAGLFQFNRCFTFGARSRRSLVATSRALRTNVSSASLSYKCNVIWIRVPLFPPHWHGGFMRTGTLSCSLLHLWDFD